MMIASIRPHALLLIAVVACSTRAPAPASEPAPFLRDVTYQFDERPPGTDKAISGTVRVIGNAAVIDAQPGPCRNLPYREARSNSYQCADVLLTADMTTSVLKLTYYTTKTVREYKSTCVRYEMNSTGQRVCAQTQTDPVEREVAISGILHLTPTDPAR